MIRRGKGQKDRPTVLPTMVIEPLSRHLDSVKRQHQTDLARGFGRVVLPFALDRKYPERGHRVGMAVRFSRLSRPYGSAMGPTDALSPPRISCPEGGWRTRHGGRASPSVWVHIPSGIRLRPTCSRTGTTFGPCTSCWVMPTSARRWCTRTCSIAARSACAVPSIASDGKGQVSVGRERLRQTTGRRAFGTTRGLVDVQQIDGRAVGPRSPWLAASARVQCRRSRPTTSTVAAVKFV